jgi:hypothetical protein
MRWFWTLCLSAALAAPAFASEELAGRIFSVATGDINGDGVDDAAFLIVAQEDSFNDHALAVSFGDGSGFEDGFDRTMTLQLYAPNFVWGGTGGLVGNRASLTIDERGSLKVLSHNSALGRGRWNQTITVAWRNEQLVVAGYTYAFYDTLDLEVNGSCDLNLLTGKGEVSRNGVSEVLESDLVRISVETWKARAGDDPCGLYNDD